MSDPVYQLRSVAVSLGERQVLGPIDIDLVSGSFVAIVGPNGSGKTTLLRTLTASVSASAGEVLLDGRPVADRGPLEIARKVGVVPQTFTLDFNFTVDEMVALGRYAHTTRDRDGRTAKAENDAVNAALQATGLEHLAGRLVTQLSGGERQRALIAQTLAQDTPTLLLDEPLNNLDLNHQLETMQLLRGLHGKGRTIVVVLHDLNMAAQYCERLILLDHGRVAADGTPAQVLEPGLILEVFKTRVSVHRQGRRPYITPVWSDPAAAAPREKRRRVHVLAGGGAAGSALEELAVRGFTPSVGVVSVFDTDYATAQSYGLEVVSAPPFEPFSTETIAESEAFIKRADAVIIAPVFFGGGNLAPLRSALRAAKTGTKVVVIDEPPIADRDMSGGEAVSILKGLREAGALVVKDAARAVDAVGS